MKTFTLNRIVGVRCLVVSLVLTLGWIGGSLALQPVRSLAHGVGTGGRGPDAGKFMATTRMATGPAMDRPTAGDRAMLSRGVGVNDALPLPMAGGGPGAELALASAQPLWVYGLGVFVLAALGIGFHRFCLGWAQTRARAREPLAVERTRGLELEVAERKRAEEALRQGEERFHLVARATNDAIWDWDVKAKVVWRNEGFQKVFQYRAGEMDWTFDCWAQNIHADDRARVVARREALLRAHGQFWSDEYRFRRADGSYAYVLDRGFVRYDAGGEPARMVGSMMDLSERRWAQQRLDLEHAVDRLLAEARSLGAAVHQVLRAVCEKLDWNRGELWSVDRSTRRLECVEVWRPVSSGEDEFDRATRGLTLSPGVDLPGRVWASGRPAGVTDMAAEEHFSRAPAAQAAELHGGFAFPVRRGAEVLGVLAFYRREPVRADADLHALFTALGDQIGQFIERQRAEHALRESEERFRSLSVCSPVGIFQSDPRGYCTYANPGCQTICGFTPDEGLGDGWTRFIHPADRDRVLEEWFKAALKGREFAGEFRFGTPQGIVRWVHLRSVPMPSGRGDLLGYVGTIEDITERKRNEVTLRRLSQRILETQEVERKRVARELHDGVIQLLSSAKFRLMPVDESVSGPGGPGREEAEKAVGLLDRAIQEVRRISQNLRPSELDDFGLAAAIRSLCDEFRDRTGLDFKLKQSRFPRTLPGEIELSVYRLVQEALNNIEKHAHATRAVVLLRGTEVGLELTIRDDGGGFESSAPEGKRSRSSGLGLVGMKERAALVGGQLTIKSVPGQGTEIVVRVPLGHHET